MGLYKGSQLISPVELIKEGGSATLITKSITQNGTYNASSDNADGFSSVMVNVSGSAPDGYIPKINRNGTLGAPTTAFTYTLPSGVTSIPDFGLTGAFQGSGLISISGLSNITNIGEEGLYRSFQGCSGLTSVDLSSLTSVSANNVFYNAFYGCSGLTSVDLSSLATVSGSGTFYHAFEGCYSLAGALDLSSLTSVSGNEVFTAAFYGCSGLTSVDLSSLTSVSAYNAFGTAFKGCSNLSSVDLSSLTTISDSDAFAWCFEGCNLTSLSFPSLTTLNDAHRPFQGICAHTSEYITSLSISFPALTTNSFDYNEMVFEGIMDDNPTVTTIHFPSNLESTIQNQWGYPTFGGESDKVTIAFDLPATS